MDNFGNAKSLWSTGNRLKDYGIGAAVGLGNLLNNPGQYYVKANWRGKGLADTGLGYIANQAYQNPYDQASMLTSMLYGKGKGFKLPKFSFNRNRGYNVISDNKIAGGNSLQDYIGNEVLDERLQPESLSDYLQQETNYGGWIPQLLPSEYDDRGVFDFSIG